MSIISASGLTMEFADRVLFSNATFSVEKGDKIGFIGANGAGKTTLFKIITGLIAPTEGIISKTSGIHIGYLEQHAPSDNEKNAYTEVLSVFKNLTDMESELEKINQKLLLNSSNELIEKQTQLNESFNLNGGLTYKNRTMTVLTGLGFSKEEINLPLSALSGGQRSKIGLAKLLLCKNDLILLDEPTNHLDIDSVFWLEDFLMSYEGATIIISHDRFFLDKVTNKTMEIENKKIYYSVGSFSRYTELKKERNEALKKDFEKKTREIERIEGIIEQQKRWNREKNIKTAESKQKQINRIEKTLEKPESELHNLKITFPVKYQSGNTVLEIDNDSCTFDNTELYKNISFTVMRGDRICLIGPNGIGKSTLIKRLASLKHNNIFKLGVGVSMGYFDQFQENLNPVSSPFEEIHNAFPALTDTQVRNNLAAFEFKEDNVFKLNSELSGGEKARVSLLKIMLKGNNFLVLDEPTNHLDIYSRTALEKALLGYEGTLLIISHDRYFINQIANKIIYFTPNGVITVNGNYDDFSLYKEKHTELFKVSQKVESQNQQKKGKEIYLNQKKLRSELNRLKSCIKKNEDEIYVTEEKISKIKADISLCQSDYQRLTELTLTLNETEEYLEKLLNEWEENNVLLQNFLAE